VRVVCFWKLDCFLGRSCYRESLDGPHQLGSDARAAAASTGASKLKRQAARLSRRDGPNNKEISSFQFILCSNIYYMCMSLQFTVLRKFVNVLEFIFVVSMLLFVPFQPSFRGHRRIASSLLRRQSFRYRSPGSL
jgi:hypothetical protein